MTSSKIRERNFGMVEGLYMLAITAMAVLVMWGGHGAQCRGIIPYAAWSDSPIPLFPAQRPLLESPGAPE